MQLFSISRKKKPGYEHGIAHKVYENKLNQDFHADEINQKWCTDFTYLFLTDGSKRYNCTINLHDRSVIASITDRNITADLAKRTLEKAILSQPGIDLSRLMVRSDYAEFRIRLIRAVNTLPKSLQNSVKDLELRRV